MLGFSFYNIDGSWRNKMVHIGAGVDSFYEYLLKTYVLFDCKECKDWHQKLTDAIYKNLQTNHWFKRIELDSMRDFSWQVDGLTAFWPGMEVLRGNVFPASMYHANLYYLWAHFHALPENFDINSS